MPTKQLARNSQPHRHFGCGYAQPVSTCSRYCNSAAGLLYIIVYLGAAGAHQTSCQFTGMGLSASFMTISEDASGPSLVPRRASVRRRLNALLAAMVVPTNIGQFVGSYATTIRHHMPPH